MGKKDSIGKLFFADEGRFAELFNTALYNGKKVIRPENLVLAGRDYPGLPGTGGKQRDILMKDREQNICYGLELETESDWSMPERVLVYDVCEWEMQIREIIKSREKREEEKRTYRERKSRMGEGDFLLPVITAVLYLGSGRWEGRNRLSELFRIPGILREQMGTRLPDYRFILVEADYVKAEDYRTELREFFQAMQCRKDKEKLRRLCRTERFRRLDRETELAIALHLDRRYLVRKIEKEGLHMCQALDEWMADERAEGKKEERMIIIRCMLQEGMDKELIRKVTKCSGKELSMAAEQ